ncbi:ATP-binding protein [Microbulbifer guangxiensis]|uniref:ATP-binding protein n=1 Tax=Microbulbifer guangxiensis TaxID=2904249 RepID=UPI001F2827BB|nr:ATP-binding protein [Microbulbifer guangxiensis]
MDETLIHGLEAALLSSPDNIPLRLSLVRALASAGEIEAAARYLEPLSGEQLSAQEQLLAAGVLQRNNSATRALDFLISTDARVTLERSRVLLTLGKLDEAKSLYADVIRENATLEDAELAKQLNARSIDTGKGPKLRVISNDDTNTSELNRILQPEQEAIKFLDIGGLKDVKKQIHKKIILPYQKPSLFSRFRKKVGGGILLYGPPGCGKTMLARATAGECKATFFNVVISDILDMYIGESESKLHAVFEQARRNSPAVIFFDEVEALATKREHTREATSSKLVSQFLAELDGFAQDNHGVLVLAATNVPWALDPAFRRPGRFDRVQFVPPPDSEARIEILRGLLDGRPGGETVDVSRVARLTPGFSGADLANLVETAIDEVIDASIESGNEQALGNEYLLEALKQVKPTTVEWLTTARNYARYANESGQYNDVLEFLKKHGK